METKEIIQKVNEWAKVYVPGEYNYNSRRTYFTSAFYAKVITQEELEQIRLHYGNIWEY